MTDAYNLPPMSSAYGQQLATLFNASALQQIADGAQSAAENLRAFGPESPERSKQLSDIARFLTLAGACRSIIETIEGETK